MRIRDNSLSMFIQNQYTKTNNALSRVMRRLASGYKINSAADDPAGLTILEKMRVQIRGLNAAKRNVQTASGTNDSGIDRKALNRELKQLKEELADIFEDAEFNGVRLFSGQYGRTTGAL